MPSYVRLKINCVLEVNSDTAVATVGHVSLLDLLQFGIVRMLPEVSAIAPGGRHSVSVAKAPKGWKP